ALAIFLDAVDRPACPRRNDEPTLAVQRQPVGPDHREFLEQRVATILPIGLYKTHAPNVLSGVPAMVQIHGDLAIRRPLVDHIGGGIAEQKVATLAFLDPERSFGKSKAAFFALPIRVRRHESIERWV